ncbi:MAG: response regulator transcription factor [Acidobacteriota bacterium]|jgi:DNA-binding response OmpR family regulator
MDKRVLVIEDEPQIARLVELHLEDLGCTVEIAGTAADGLMRMRSQPADLVILDLMLPDRDGLEVCRELRTRKDYVPILILTARSGEVDRVLGLELGADDYLTKPFSIRELIARVKAIFRRVEALSEREDQPEPMEIEDLVIDPEKRRVLVHGEPVHLTAKEFDLLVQFARHPGRVFTRSELLDLVWGYTAGCYEHTVNSHINRLRGKIEKDPSEPHYVRTVWGVGYSFVDPGQAGEGDDERRARP